MFFNTEISLLHHLNFLALSSLTVGAEDILPPTNTLKLVTRNPLRTSPSNVDTSHAILCIYLTFLRRVRAVWCNLKPLAALGTLLTTTCPSTRQNSSAALFSAPPHHTRNRQTSDFLFVVSPIKKQVRPRAPYLQVGPRCWLATPPESLAVDHTRRRNECWCQTIGANAPVTFVSCKEQHKIVLTHQVA